MAVHFDEINQYLSMASPSTLSGNWTVGAWLKLDDNAGSLYQYFWSWNAPNATPSLNGYFRESGVSSPNLLEMIIEDNDGTNMLISSSTTPGTSTDWQHIMLIKSGSTVTLYVNNVSVGSATNAAFGDIDYSGAFFIGGRTDLNADRFYGGSMGEFFIMNSAADATQRAAIVAGACPRLFSPAVWPPLYNDYVERVASLTVTPYNTPTFVAHPTIKDPGRRRKMMAA